jgi:hypothetical protein
MDLFGVFASYAHDDEGLAESVAAPLEQLGAANLWDRSIEPGRPFTEEIKTFIS